ncbi:alpha/beta hydrolase [Actinoplanes sp. Pm04-4]|uniref:Alpha/beta hydrolase n=1 Tax=Paractinoplanes pyxinae TaxID=2997416 RepID=A0ABT4ASC5_9ACTN|nr:alpha/beta hydrolase [Actinoplanes pyxinae]MCY1137141.1 alpha/beta hydrolase [Actinoplanes pyxinae]
MIPTSVSEGARQILAVPRIEASWPAPDDVEGWEKHIAQADAGLLERFASVGQLPVAVDDREIAGVRTFVARMEEDDSGPIYLDIHGGALIMGGGELCRAFTVVTAMTNGMVTWGVDYRMPPHHPYPAGLDDCVAVYRALLEARSPDQVFVGGASAGGNLAAALMVRAREEGLPMPAALVLNTPELDLTESGDSFHINLAYDNVLGPLLEVNRLYAAGHDLADPHLSPLFADVSGFPPTFLQAGTRDLFLSNAVRMHRKLRNAGVDAELHIGEAMPHGGFTGNTPEDLDLAAERRRFLDKHRREAAA